MGSNKKIRTGYFTVKLKCTVLRWCVVLGTLMFVISCGDSNTDNVGDTTQTKPHEIPFTIELQPGYRVVDELNMVGWTYYIRYEGIDSDFEDAGIYFGSMPDTSSPSYYSAKREYRDEILGDTANWREFKGRKLFLRDALLENSPGQFTNAWCYSADSATVELLTGMLKSIRMK